MSSCRTSVPSRGPVSSPDLSRLTRRVARQRARPPPRPIVKCGADLYGTTEVPGWERELVARGRPDIQRSSRWRRSVSTDLAEAGGRTPLRRYTDDRRSTAALQLPHSKRYRCFTATWLALQRSSEWPRSALPAWGPRTSHFCGPAACCRIRWSTGWPLSPAFTSIRCGMHPECHLGR